MKKGISNLYALTGGGASEIVLEKVALSLSRRKGGRDPWPSRKVEEGENKAVSTKMENDVMGGRKGGG